MSRTTIVGSPVMVPITRASPAGTGVSQRTSEAPPGVPVGFDDGVEEAPAGGLAVTVGWAVGLGEVAPVDGAPPHAASASTAAAATRVRSTG
jgi:hypothetical protein